MPTTRSQGNPLILLDIKIERTLRNNRRMDRVGIHDPTALLQGVIGGGEHHD